MPCLRLQFIAARAGIAKAVDPALKETHERGIHLQADNRLGSWYGYAKAIIDRKAAESSAIEVLHSATRQMSGDDVVDQIDSFLAECRRSNQSGDYDNAKNILAKAQKLAPKLAPHLEADTMTALAAITWAFKIGEIDVLGALDNQHPAVDYLPEFVLPETMVAGLV
jgi:hypothetical protein